MKDTYFKTVTDVYKSAAENPDVGLCCTTTPIWQMPDLHIPPKMLDMNYGCGSTVNPRDLVNNPSILYVGVGGGMELLQFAYFSRKPGRVIGVDSVVEMLYACKSNLIEAQRRNDWFKREFVNLKEGSALDLPVEDSFVDVAAQNCLFNIFKQEDLKKALSEMYRVLKPHGRLILSDPVCDTEISDDLKNDSRLRALCLSSSIPLSEYVKLLSETGFGTIEVRAKRPYRILSPNHYNTDKLIYIESVEICAIKNPMPADGPCIFTGKTAIYFGDKDYFDDNNGHIMKQNQPLAICDKTAKNLSDLGRDDIFISDSTWFYDGGGCC
ncbi:arsenosugar biosynthesis arsenite methyltransferase ArsM [Ignavibacterium sp.]|uniref:arsenosugar biosynthesis arsenite methyltransferase ArsM n=1 Tax=Ignavibacterium sp. TaxID=2651167 RepID=UPI00307FAA11